jgi:hypothetical protein
MADHDIETNKNLNFEIKIASISHQMRAKIEIRSWTPCDADGYASLAPRRQQVQGSDKSGS